jgi:hypothetical protein
MIDSSFPQLPSPPVVTPEPAELIVRREPLSAIRELLAISIDDIVNRGSCKRVVYELYRITRRVENESWLRRRLAAIEDEAWTAAHL